jgi:hypothetical protein
VNSAAVDLTVTSDCLELMLTEESYAAPCMLNQASNSASRSSIIDNGDA